MTNYQKKIDPKLIKLLFFNPGVAVGLEWEWKCQTEDLEEAEVEGDLLDIQGKTY